MQLQDAIHAALVTQGYLGNLNDQLLAYYIAGGATGLSIADAQAEFLVAQGATPAHVNDMWFEILVTAGYTGSLSDMLYAFWVAGGSFNPGGVTPADLANLVRWHKADGTLYTDSEGTDLVDTNLDPIGYATDESGAGNHITQTVSASKPTWGSVDPSMGCDGGDTLSSFDDLTTQSMTICTVAKDGLGDAIMGAGSTTLNHWYVRQDANRTLLIHTAGAQKVGVFTEFLGIAGTKYINFYTIDGVGKLLKGYRFTGGVLVESAITGTFDNLLTEEDGLFVLGGQAIDDVNPTPAFDGDIYEIFQTSDVLSNADMTAQGESLAAKWGVS